MHIRRASEPTIKPNFLFNRIEINIDLNDRPKGPDPSKILERLEQIEKETQDRFKEELLKGPSNNTEEGASSSSYLPNSAFNTMSNMSDFESFRLDMELFATNNIDFLVDIHDLHSVSSERVGSPSNNDAASE